MNREQYIGFRLSSQFKAIMYYYSLESGIKFSYQEFKVALDNRIHLVVQNCLTAGIIINYETIFNLLAATIIEDYDVKFEVIYLFEVDAETGNTVFISIR